MKKITIFKGLTCLMLLLVSTPSISQNSCFLFEKEIKEELIKLMPGDNKIFKDSSSAFFIVDIKFDKFRNSTCSVDYFYKASLANFILKNKNQLDNIFHRKWNNSCPVDRILIPIYILPLFDNAKINEYPFEIYSGWREINAGTLKQYVFQEIIITINKDIP